MRATSETVERIAQNLSKKWNQELAKAQEKFPAYTALDWNIHLSTWLGAMNSETVSAEHFFEYLGSLSDMLDNQDMAIGAAHQYVSEIAQGRLSEEEIRFLALYLCGSTVLRWREAQEENSLRAHFTLHEDDSTNQPDVNLFLEWPRWIANQPRELLDHLWKRSIDLYPNPQHTTLTTEIDSLLLEQEVVKVLDIGMGTGYMLEELREKYSSRVDTTGVTLVNSQPEVDIDTVHYGPAEVLPLEWTNSFDIVVSNVTFLYLLDPRSAISEALRVLKPERMLHLRLYRWAPPLPELMDFLSEQTGTPVVDITMAWKERFDSILSQKKWPLLVSELAQESGGDAVLIPGDSFHALKTKPSAY
jgi:SAM-dependent methyltransferase